MFKKTIFFIFLFSLIFLKSLTLMAAGIFAYVPTRDNTGNKISIINVAAGTFTEQPLISDIKYVNGVHISPNGKILFIIYSKDKPMLTNGAIAQLELATNSFKVSNEILGKGARSPVVTPDEKSIFTLNFSDGSFSKVDTQDMSSATTYRTFPFPNSAVISPDGKYLYIAHEFGNEIRKINIATMNEEASGKTHATNINNFISEEMTITPDGQKLIIAHRESIVNKPPRGGLSFVNTSDLSIEKFIRFDLDGGLLGVTISPDGKTVYVTAGAASNVYSMGINESTFNQFENLTSIRTASGLGVTPDGKNLIYGVGAENFVKIYRLDVDFLKDSNGIVNLQMPGPETSGNFITPIAITSPLSASGKVDAPFEYSLTASSYLPIIEKLVDNLPPGLSFNSISNKITGTPTQEGDFNIQLKVKNKFVQIEESLNLKIVKKDEVIPPNPPNPQPPNPVPNDPTPPAPAPVPKETPPTDSHQAEGSGSSGGCSITHDTNSIGLLKFLLPIFSLMYLLGMRIYKSVTNESSGQSLKPSFRRKLRDFDR